MARRKKKILKKLKYSPAAIAFILPEKFLLIGNSWMKKVKSEKLKVKSENKKGRRWSKGLIRDILKKIVEQGMNGIKVSRDELEKTMWSLLSGEIKSEKFQPKAGPPLAEKVSAKGQSSAGWKSEKLVEFIYKTGEENVRRRIGQASDLRIAGKWPSLSDPATKLVYNQYHKNPFLAVSYNKRPIHYLIINYSRSDRTRGQVFIDEMRRQIEEYHALNFHRLQEGSEGWEGRTLKNRADIDCHYLIDSVGNILAGRPDQYFAWSANSREVDYQAISIVILGDLRRAKIAQKQFQSLIPFAKTLIDLYKIEKSKKKVLLAKDLQTCGKNFPREEFFRELGT